MTARPVASITCLNGGRDLFSFLLGKEKEVKLKIQQHVISFLRRNIGLFVLLVILGATFFGIALRAQTVYKAHAATASSANSDVESIIQQVFGSYASGAINVANCESSENPNATNPTPVGSSYAEGLFQILYPSTWSTTSQTGNSPYDATANTVAAHDIFVRDGYSWREWSCQP